MLILIKNNAKSNYYYNKLLNPLNVFCTYLFSEFYLTDAKLDPGLSLSHTVQGYILNQSIILPFIMTTGKSLRILT